MPDKVEPVISLPHSFTNSAGKTYTVHGLSPILPERLMSIVRDEYVKSGKTLPVCPTYKVTTVAGDEEIHEHNPKTLAVENDPEQTKINQKDWREYSQKSLDINRLYNTRLIKSALLAVDAQPTSVWRDEMAFIGITLPLEGSAEERYMFVETEVIKSPADLSSLMILILHQSGIIDEEVAGAAEATFRRQVERAFRQAGRKAGKAK